jgi:hypothetical protein
MSERSTAATACGGLLLACALAWSNEAPQANAPAGRRQEGSSRSAPVQGQAGIAPVAGAPSPAPPGPLPSQPVAVRIAPPARAAAPAPAFRALALAEGEGTLEIDGAPRTVKPGERLGRDTVRSIAPGQLVLERAASAAGAPPVLVIVTFDDSGRAHTRTIHTRDETAPVAPEVRRP